MLLVLGVTFALICKEASRLAWLEPLEDSQTLAIALISP